MFRFIESIPKRAVLFWTLQFIDSVLWMASKIWLKIKSLSVFFWFTKRSYSRNVFEIRFASLKCFGPKSHMAFHCKNTIKDCSWISKCIICHMLNELISTVVWVHMDLNITGLVFLSQVFFLFLLLDFFFFWLLFLSFFKFLNKLLRSHN